MSEENTSDTLGIIINDGSCKWIIIDTRDTTPVGRVVGDTALRKGYIKANGATVLREDYPRLVKFANDYSLWTTDKTNYPALFGVGDGSTTMELPDYRGRFIEMSDSDAGKVIAAGLPNIKGQTNFASDDNGSPGVGPYGASGAFYGTGSVIAKIGDIDGWRQGQNTLVLDASRSSSIYGNSTTVQPPAINLIAAIRY